MNDLEFTVQVTGPGLEMTRPVDQEMAFRVLAVLMGGATVADGKDHRDARPRVAGTASERDGVELSVGEYLANLNAQTNPDRIAGILLFAREELQRARLARDDIPDWFSRAGLPAPGNLPRDINQAIARRLIAEDPSHKGQFYVTQTGIDRLRSTAAPPGGRSDSNRKRVRASNEVDDTDQETLASDPKRRRRGATKAGSGPMERIRALIGDGWFATPRTASNIVTRLLELGANYKRTDLTRQLETLTQAGELLRRKQMSEKLGKEVWHYYTEGG